MKIDLNDKYDFIPEFGDNKEDENPIVFHCRLMTPAERQKCIKEEVVTVGDGTEVRVSHDEELIAKTIIVSIENLIVDGETITKAPGLLDVRGISGLTRELAMDAISKNMRADLKNSE